MNDTPFFAPERLVADEFTIRCYMPGDGSLMAEAVNASYDHLRIFMPWAQPHTEVVQAEQTVRSWRAKYLLSTDFVLGIFSPDNRRLLGSSGFHLREGGLENRAAEIGMWIRANAAGEGLGTSVLCAVLEWGFSAWPWDRLTWHCDERNIASRCTAEKAGMLYEGRLRGVRLLPDGKRENTLGFAALRSEWKRPVAGVSWYGRCASVGG